MLQVLSEVELRSKFFVLSHFMSQNKFITNQIFPYLTSGFKVEQVDKDFKTWQLLLFLLHLYFEVWKCHREKKITPLPPETPIRFHSSVCGTVQKSANRVWLHSPPVWRPVKALRHHCALCVVSLWFDYVWATCCLCCSIQLSASTADVILNTTALLIILTFFKWSWLW